MARRAKFGQRPRVQQSLSGTLVAIAHEMVARQDSNLMDAWKNGGEFEGRKVTDEMVLAHFKEREKDLDKNDPLYDSYKDQVLQLEYGIEQSKMDLKHVQGKIDDKTYAQFFIKWSKRVPQNSEWWRSLQKDAAQLMESAKAKGEANARKQKQDSFNAFVMDQNKTIGLGNALADAMSSLSHDTGLTIEGNGDRLLQLLTSDYTAHPDKYHALTDSIKASGVHFGGTFTTSFFRTAIQSTADAYGKVATRANRDGYAPQYADATKGQAQMSNVAVDMNIWPVSKAYETAYTLFAQTWNNPAASAMDKKAAAATFSNTITNLTRSPGLDTASVTMLQADAARALGQDAGDSPSFGSQVLGHTAITPEIAQSVAYQTNAELAMQQNPLAYKYASVDKNGNFDPTGQSPVGIVPIGAIPVDAVFVAIPGLSGAARMVAIQPHDVKVNDPSNPDAAPTVAGKVLTYQVGGQTITLYRYSDDKGAPHWTARNPWVSGSTGRTDSKTGDVIMTLPNAAADVVAQAKAFEKTYGVSGLAERVAAVKDSLDPSATANGTAYTYTGTKATGHVQITYTPGKGFTMTRSDVSRNSTGQEVLSGGVTTALGFTPTGTLLQGAVAPSAYVGGSTIPGVYDSPAAASVDAMASSAMSGGQIGALAQDPNFQHAFMQQTMENIGTANPFDPRVVAAWDSATQRATKAEGDTRLGYGSPTDRTDLNYPGVSIVNDPTKTTANITFGGQTLKLPGLPAYLNNAQGQAPKIDINNPLAFAATGFLRQVLGIGGMPAPTQQPTADTRAGYGTVTQTPMPTVTPTPGVSVTTSPASVSTSSSTYGVPTPGKTKQIGTA
jgi:hypothetical protein